MSSYMRIAPSSLSDFFFIHHELFGILINFCHEFLSYFILFKLLPLVTTTHNFNINLLTSSQYVLVVQDDGFFVLLSQFSFGT